MPGQRSSITRRSCVDSCEPHGGGRPSGGEVEDRQGLEGPRASVASALSHPLIVVRHSAWGAAKGSSIPFGRAADSEGSLRTAGALRVEWRGASQYLGHSELPDARPHPPSAAARCFLKTQPCGRARGQAKLVAPAKIVQQRRGLTLRSHCRGFDYANRKSSEHPGEEAAGRDERRGAASTGGPGLLALGSAWVVVGPDGIWRDTAKRLGEVGMGVKGIGELGLRRGDRWERRAAE